MIELGSKVRDIVTGFEGIASSRIEYLNGCIQYGVKPKVSKGATKIEDTEYIDEGQLEVIGNGVNVSKSYTGGYMPDAPKHKR